MSILEVRHSLLRAIHSTTLDILSITFHVLEYCQGIRLIVITDTIRIHHPWPIVAWTGEFPISRTARLVSCCFAPKSEGSMNIHDCRLKTNAKKTLSMSSRLLFDWSTEMSDRFIERRVRCRCSLNRLKRKEQFCFIEFELIANFNRAHVISNDEIFINRWERQISAATRTDKHYEQVKSMVRMKC